MESIVGIFNSSAEAARAIARMKLEGIPNNRINLLVPGASPTRLAGVPTTDTEQAGIGEALGAVVGGTIGAAGGMSLGAAAASILVPGVGPVMAIGILAAALLGAGGALGGATAGKALEENMAEGLPIDEMFVYEDALRQGRSVVIVLAEGSEEANAARKVLQKANAESIDSARENWWIGLRGAEEANYTAQGKDFRAAEPNFRNGFEAALHPQTRGKSYAEVINYLMAHHPETYREPSFRRGYERGQAHYLELVEKHQNAA